MLVSVELLSSTTNFSPLSGETKLTTKIVVSTVSFELEEVPRYIREQEATDGPGQF
jgi:hypothetical protein